MVNNSMAISLAQNSPSSCSEFRPSSDHRTSSSQLHHHLIETPPPAINPATFMTPTSKKPRGRPAGSKNKIKPTSIPVAQSEPTVKIVSVNVPSGSDIIEYIVDVACRGHVNVSILSATGNITSVALRHASSMLTFHGPFTLIALNGSYLYNNQYNLHPEATYPPCPLTFGINLATSRGQVFGGAISGRVIAGKDVTIVLFTYRNPEIYDDNNNNNHYDSKT